MDLSQIKCIWLLKDKSVENITLKSFILDTVTNRVESIKL